MEENPKDKTADPEKCGVMKFHVQIAMRNT